LRLLGLSRFDKPICRVSWSGYDYAQSVAYDLGDGHYLSLWFGYEGDVSEGPKSQRIGAGPGKSGKSVSGRVLVGV
jgi:hypothetical protein